ncbi:MAG TPA: alginate lyase family protein [Bryobacteraceae bacterium]|nr:alginate lyase family protein [Bryobacteraceae bacterium]
MTLVSEDEAEPIHSAIIRKEAWTQDSVRRLRAEAEKRLREGPWSITSDRPKGIELDTHEYYSEAPDWWPDPENPTGPYIRHEGQFNPIRFMGNHNALDAMCDAVFTLGTAAFLLDDVRYAQRAVRVINVWFLSPKTRMNPDLDHARAVPGIDTGTGNGVLDGRGFIRAIQGMEFLAQTPSWDPREQAGVHRWFLEYLQWLMHSASAEEERNSGNNHASWWTAQTAAVATFVGDHGAEQMAFNFYTDRIFPRQIRANGSAPREEVRTRSLSNSALNLEAYAMICRIAQVNGVDLWDVRARNGATIATVIDYLAPFLSDPRKWTIEQVADFQSEGLYSLAFAGMGLKKPEYVALYHKLEKPEGAWLSLVDLMVGRWEAAGHQTRH